MRRSAFRSSRRHGILPHETFAVKNMEASSNLLKLKLDMVYHDVPVEEAQKRFDELSQAPPEKALEPVAVVKAPKKRKVIKGLVPKEK